MLCNLYVKITVQIYEFAPMVFFIRIDKVKPLIWKIIRDSQSDNCSVLNTNTYINKYKYHISPSQMSL